jgi:capsular polysaccharide biosynthesis protein
MSYKYLQLTPLLYGWPVMLLAGAVGGVIAVLFSLLHPLEYSSTTRILITQELSNVDAYTASRSAERIADDLTGVIYTSDFFHKVMKGDAKIDQSYFPVDEISLRKKWEKTVTASVSYSSGMMDIVAYNTDPAQAKEIATAVANIYVTEGASYISGGDITVRVVDDPLNSRYPVRPNLPLNGISGLFLGALGGMAYVYIQADRQRRRHSVMHLEEDV